MTDGKSVLYLISQKFPYIFDTGNLECDIQIINGHFFRFLKSYHVTRDGGTVLQ